MHVYKQEVLDELKKELHFHQNGGTSYRVATVKLAMQLADKVEDPMLFRKQASTFEAAKRLLDGADTDRVNDVSKMVSVIVNDLHRQKKQPPEMRKYVEQKRRHRKPLTFIPK